MWKLTLVLIGLAQVLGVARSATGQGAPTGDAWSVETFAKSSEGRFALGLYGFGSKLGWITTDTRLEERDGRSVLVERIEFYIRQAKDGQESNSMSRSESVFRLTGDGDLIAYTDVDEDSGSINRTEVRLDGDELLIVRTTGDREITRRVPRSRDTLQERWRKQRWLSGDRVPGDVYESISTDFDAEAPDPIHEPEILEFRGRTSVRWAGVETAVLSIQMSVHEFPFPIGIKLLPDDTPVTLSFGGVLTARLEDETVAKQLDLPVDMLAATSVPIGLDLGDPELIGSLTLAVEGHAGFAIPESARQRVQADGERTLLHLSRADLADETPLSDEDRAIYLAATERFEAEDPRIAETAEELAGHLSGTLKRAGTLALWVDDLLEDHYARNAETSVQILQNRAGDCTEHACLFVALARAAGIPSREVGGLVYGGDGNFAWHAWAEVHDGTRWVSVDPSWRQVFVDPTHIKLSNGEDDHGWFALVGQMELEVDDITRREDDAEAR